MTSQLNVDTIVDKAGSGGTNVKIANNAVTVAEGGSATTTTVQGLGKVWSNIDQTGQSVRDSFNSSGVTDNGTGRSEVAFSNNMNNDHYVVSGISKDGSGYNDDTGLSADFAGAITTSAFEVFCHHDATANDANFALMIVHGDLA